MFYFFLARLIAMIFALIGAGFVISSKWYVSLIGMVIFVAAIFVIEIVAVHREARMRMPHCWTCDRCQLKKLEVGVQASDPDLVLSFIQHHNREVHLEE